MVEKGVVKSLIVCLLVLGSLFMLPMASAFDGCLLNASLINQDPYPAIPGDYVKLVFQVNGIENPNCGQVSVKINEAFPFTLDPGTSDTYTGESFFNKDYTSILLAPFTVRVDEEALDGDNPVEIAVSYTLEGIKTTFLQEFNVNIEDKRADFEIYAKDYDSLTNTLTLEILNTGKYDIQALTIDIPPQKNIEVKGAARSIVGDLDSNEYTTADFEAVSEGGEINLELTYTDGINVRRILNKTIMFEKSYFEDRKKDEKQTPLWIYIIIPVVLLIILISLFRAYKNRKHKKD